MFCAQCGTQNPDGSRFCANCGAVFEEQPIVEESVIQETKAEEPVVEEAVIQETIAEETTIPETIAADPAASEPAAQAPVQEPVYQQSQQPVYQQPVQQPMYQQPAYQQPMYQQPAYGQPYFQQPRVRTPMDPKKKKAITITVFCGAVLAAFLIVLFAAIIPNSGFKGKLRHSWKREGWFATTVIDLKHKTWSSGSEVITISKWKVDGNYLTITTTSTGFASNVQSYVFAMTPDGSTLLLFDAEGYTPGDSPDYIYVRAD